MRPTFLLKYKVFIIYPSEPVLRTNKGLYEKGVLAVPCHLFSPSRFNWS